MCCMLKLCTFLMSKLISNFFKINSGCIRPLEAGKFQGKYSNLPVELFTLLINTYRVTSKTLTVIKIVHRNFYRTTQQENMHILYWCIAWLASLLNMLSALLANVVSCKLTA